MDHIEGKKVALIGLSVEGVDAIPFLISLGCSVMCLDSREISEFEALQNTYKGKDVVFHCGPTYLERIHEADYVVRSPGVSLRIPELESFRSMPGKILTSATQLFFSYCKAPIIGVTGTKGKGTTCTLIYEMCKAEGKQVYLGGNVGTPLLSQVLSIPDDAVVVYELSSFQLEDMKMSPHIAVVLRITQDHLANFDPHASSFHATREEYVAAKSSIVRFQSDKDFAIVNATDETALSFAKLTVAQIKTFTRDHDKDADCFVKNQTVFFHEKDEYVEIVRKDTMKMLGVHNLDNIAAAALASRLVGVSIDNIKKVACTFPGLEHRLERTRTVGGVTYINDSFSTVPETTIAAIESFDAPLVLIVGGSEKMSDFSHMAEIITKNNVITVIAIGQMTEKIVNALKHAGYEKKIITGCKNMEEIVHEAHACAPRGSVVLMSPACASFGMFHNYKERGTLFKYAVSHI